MINIVISLIVGIVVGYLLHSIVMKFSSTLTLPEEANELLDKQIKVINEGNWHNFEMIEKAVDGLENLDYSNTEKLKEEIEKIKNTLIYRAV